MTNTSRNDVVAASKSAAENIPALSNALLDGAEKLFALNLNTARAALAEYSAAGSEQGGVAGLTTTLAPIWEKSLAYSRHAGEIIAGTHGELTRLLLGQFASLQLTAGGVPAGFAAIFGKGFEQWRASANGNLEALTAATSKAVATARSHVPKGA